MNDPFSPHPASLFCSCPSCFKKRKDYILAKTDFMLADLEALEWPEEADTMNPPVDFSGVNTVIVRMPTKRTA